MAQTLQDMKARYPNDPLRTRMIDKFLNGSESKVLPLCHFIDGKGFKYDWIQRDSLGGITTRAINGGTYSTQGSRSSIQTEPMALFGGDIKTDYVLIDVKGDAARMDELDAKMKAAGKYFDKMFFNGDPSQAGNANQLRGLKVRAAGTQLFWMGTNGGAIDLDTIDQAQDAVAGDNAKKVIFCNRFVRRKISSLVRASAGGKGIYDAQRQLLSYNDSPIIVIDEDEAYAQILDFTETRGSSSLTTSLYVMRFGSATDDEWVQPIAGNSWMQLRPPSPQGTYVLEVAESLAGLGTFHPRSFARIGGITQA